MLTSWWKNLKIFEYVKIISYTCTIINIIKLKNMSAKQELFEQISSEFQLFVENHGGTTKASQQRARKHIGEVKKLITDYRKASVTEG